MADDQRRGVRLHLDDSAWENVTNPAQQKMIRAFMERHGAVVMGFNRSVEITGGMNRIQIAYKIPAEELRAIPGWCKVTYGPRGGIRDIKSSAMEHRKRMEIEDARKGRYEMRSRRGRIRVRRIG